MVDRYREHSNFDSGLTRLKRIWLASSNDELVPFIQMSVETGRQRDIIWAGWGVFFVAKIRCS